MGSFPHSHCGGVDANRVVCPPSSTNEEKSGDHRERRRIYSLVIWISVQRVNISLHPTISSTEKCFITHGTADTVDSTTLHSIPQRTFLHPLDITGSFTAGGPHGQYWQVTLTGPASTHWWISTAPGTYPPESCGCPSTECVVLPEIPIGA